MVDSELARTDGLSIDDTLNKFAKDNSHIIKQLILLECNDFQRPAVKQMLQVSDEPNINYERI